MKLANVLPDGRLSRNWGVLPFRVKCAILDHIDVVGNWSHELGTRIHKETQSSWQQKEPALALTEVDVYFSGFPSEDFARESVLDSGRAP